jgi:hypothetical protein
MALRHEDAHHLVGKRTRPGCSRLLKAAITLREWLSSADGGNDARLAAM